MDSAHTTRPTARTRSVQAIARSGEPLVDPLQDPLAAVRPLQRTTAAIQRHGGQPGVPGAHTIAADTVLYHGTRAGQFSGDSGMPDPPVWLADTRIFALHAAAQHATDQPQSYVHHFTAVANIQLLAFDDCADLEAYITEHLHQFGSGGNLAMDARRVLAANRSADGYMLERDLGRGEPEYVLFAGGVAKLRLDRSVTVDQQLTVGQDATHVDQSIGGRHVGRWTRTDQNATYTPAPESTSSNEQVDTNMPSTSSKSEVVEQQPQVLDLGNHGRFVVGQANGEGMNCLIESIALALRTQPSSEEVASIREALDTIRLTQPQHFVWNDQQVLSAILEGLGEDPQLTGIYFVTGNVVDDQTYAFGGQLAYIYNVGNVHFSPMFPVD